jgi:hypothetical protein
MSIVVQANDLLRQARLARRSPSEPGVPMSRQELATAANVHVHTASGRVVAIGSNYIGKLERGVIRWPYKLYRTALRAVLGATDGAHLGIYTAQVGTDVRPMGHGSMRRSRCSAPLSDVVTGGGARVEPRVRLL